MLFSPQSKKLIGFRNANQVLKDEIQESQLRVKAAKYGHKLDDIVPPYDQSFYLPDKSHYFAKGGVTQV